MLILEQYFKVGIMKHHEGSKLVSVIKLPLDMTANSMFSLKPNKK